MSIVTDRGILRFCEAIDISIVLCIKDSFGWYEKHFTYDRDLFILYNFY